MTGGGLRAHEGGAAVYDFVVDLVSRRLPAGGTVLELGCGAMQYAPLLEGRYLGLDLPDSAHIRERPQLVASADDVPLPDGAVDVVFAVASLHLVIALDAALHEARRVLRRGGHLLVFDYQRPVLDRLAAMPEGDVRNLWTPRELRARLTRAGFPRTGIRDLSHRARVGGDPSILLRPLFLAKDRVRRGQWLVMEARR